MVDRADLILAVWDGRPGGTEETVKYAQYKGKDVTVINPNTLSVTKKSAKFSA